MNKKKFYAWYKQNKLNLLNEKIRAKKQRININDISVRPYCNYTQWFALRQFYWSEAEIFLIKLFGGKFGEYRYGGCWATIPPTMEM